MQESLEKHSACFTAMVLQNSMRIFGRLGIRRTIIKLSILLIQLSSTPAKEGCACE